MTQLELVYGGNFTFSLKYNDIQIGWVSYEYHGDEIDHLTDLKSYWETFKNQFASDKKSIRLVWGNEWKAGIELNYDHEQIYIGVDSYEQAGAGLLIPVIDKSKVLEHLDQIIKAIDEEIKQSE